MSTDTMKLLTISAKHDPTITPELLKASDQLRTSLIDCPVCAALKVVAPDGLITCKACGRDDNE